MLTLKLLGLLTDFVMYLIEKSWVRVVMIFIGNPDDFLFFKLEV